MGNVRRSLGAAGRMTCSEVFKLNEQENALQEPSFSEETENFWRAAREAGPKTELFLKSPGEFRRFAHAPRQRCGSRERL